MDKQLTKHFSLSEFVGSPTARKIGIDNTPTSEALDNLKALANAICEPARQGLRLPIRITSGYRSWRLNRAVGGVKGSQHEQGEAVDLVCQDNRALFEYIRRYLIFDQLIWEHGDEHAPQWVHVSYTKRRPNRGQVLRAKRQGGRTKYIALCLVAMLLITLPSCRSKRHTTIQADTTTEKIDSLTLVGATETLRRWEIVGSIDDYTRVRIVRLDSMGTPREIVELEEGRRVESQEATTSETKAHDSLSVVSRERVEEAIATEIKTDTKAQPLFPWWGWLVLLVVIFGFFLRLSPVRLLRRYCHGNSRDAHK